MRTLVALAAIGALAAPAQATSINPAPRGRAKGSPNNQFVFVRVTPHGWSLDGEPDAEAIRERCKASGLYRRGAWDAPLWAFDAFGPWSVYLPSDDGVHLAEYSYVTPCTIVVGWEDPQYRDTVSRADTFTFYASGKKVRTVPLCEIAGDLHAALSKGKWLQAAEFRSDGLLHVTASDGNQTAFDPATGRRVYGEGVREPGGRVWWYAVAAVVVSGAVAVGAVWRVRRLRKVKVVAAALAVAALGLTAPRAEAYSIRIPDGWTAASPDGRYVLVYAAARYDTPGADPDAAAIRERCKASGVYRRGEWDKPLWSLPGVGYRGWVSNDGAHAVATNAVPRPYVTADGYQGWTGVTQYTIYAEGRAVRALTEDHFFRTRAGMAAARGRLESIGFGPDGRFRVTAGDGNRTAFDPATGERVEGEGAEAEPLPPTPPPQPPTWRERNLDGWAREDIAVTAIGVTAAGGLAVLRLSRRRR